MAEENKSLQDLGSLDGPAGRPSSVPVEAAKPVYVQKLDKQGRAYATGKRKNAVARVWIKPGRGKITVNDKDFSAYFARPVLQMLLKQPLRHRQPRSTSTTSRRPSSAAGCRARPALCVTASPRRSPTSSRSCAGVLKKGGFLTRDSRVVERKKYGRMKARRSFQFSKR